MISLPSYYAAPIAEERLRPLAEDLAACHGCSYEWALIAIRAAIGQDTRTVPRYTVTIDRRVIRVWGKPLLNKGRRARST